MTLIIALSLAAAVSARGLLDKPQGHSQDHHQQHHGAGAVKSPVAKDKIARTVSRITSGLRAAM